MKKLIEVTVLLLVDESDDTEEVRERVGEQLAAEDMTLLDVAVTSEREVTDDEVRDMIQGLN